MNFTVNEEGKLGVIKVEGPLTVRNIAEARSLLLSALQSVDELVFDVNGVTEADLCALQLGCSMKRTAVKMKKKVVYPKTVPPAFSKAVEEAGACFHAGCDLAGERCFFWKRGLV